MNKLVCIILLCGGAIAIAFGVQSMNSFSSDVSNFFTGSPTNKSVWLLAGGIVAALIGLGGIFRRRKA